MSINRLYPICHHEKPAIVKEFFSGFFYLGRVKYIQLPSTPEKLVLRKDLQKSVCVQNGLKIALWMTGFIPIIAAVYKLIEQISLSKKKITIINNEDDPKVNPAEVKLKSEAEKVQVVKEIQEIKSQPDEHKLGVKLEQAVLGMKLDLTAQHLTREEVEKRLQEVPPIQTIYLNRNAALKEYIWVADLLKNNPKISLEFEDAEEDIEVSFEKNIMDALKIYAIRNREFSEFVFQSFNEMISTNKNQDKEFINGFLEISQILASLNMLNVERLFENEKLSIDEKIKSCQTIFDLIKDPTVNVLSGNLLAELNLSEQNREVLFKTMSSKTVLSFLEMVLDLEDDKKIEMTFKSYFQWRKEVDLRFKTIKSLPLILEKIDTAEKALAVYKASPNEELKKILTEGLKQGGITYKTKVGKEAVEKVLKLRQHEVL